MNESLILALGTFNFAYSLFCCYLSDLINNSFPFNFGELDDARTVISADFDGKLAQLRHLTRLVMTYVIHVYLRDIYLIYRWYKPEPIFISELVHFWFPYSCNRSSLWPLKMLNGVTFNE